MNLKQTNRYGADRSLVQGPFDEQRPAVTLDGLLLFDRSHAIGSDDLQVMSIPRQSLYKHIRKPAPVDAVPGDQLEAATLAGTPIVVYADNRTGQFDLRAMQLRNGRQRGHSWLVVADGYER